MDVADFVSMLSDKGFTLVAGIKGTGNTITGMNMMENPDTISWLKKGEFLLTTGYLLKDDNSMQIELIKQLAAIEASGIGIKKHRYIEKISDELIDVANRYGLPIVEIPYEYSLSEVSNVFYKEVYNQQSAVLQKSLDIHEHLTEIVLKGGGIGEIAKELVYLINNPLILMNEQGKILALQDMDENPYPLRDMFSQGENGKAFPGDFFKGLPDNIIKRKEAVKYQYKLRDILLTFRIKPVVADKTLYGYLAVIECVRKLRAIDYIAIERAATLVVLDRMKYKAIEETKHMLRRDFFDDLLEGKIQSEKEVISLAGIHGLNAKLRYAAMVFEIEKEHEQSTRDFSHKAILLRVKEQLENIIEDMAMDEKLMAVSIIRGAYVISFLSSPPYLSEKQYKSLLTEFGTSIENKFRKDFGGYGIIIGIGKSYPILELSKSFKEAMETIKIISQFNSVKRVAHFDDFIIYHLLDTGTNEGLLKQFFESSIKRLVDYDSENKTNLVDTLDTYFKCKGNISEAAKMMFVHRNTFIYRIDKVKEILGTDLENSEELLEYQVGIRIMRLLSVYSK